MTVRSSMLRSWATAVRPISYAACSPSSEGFSRKDSKALEYRSWKSFASCGDRECLSGNTRFPPPLRHGHRCSLARMRLDVEVVHEPTCPRQPQAGAPSGGVLIAQGKVNVLNAGPPVARLDGDALSSIGVDGSKCDLP